MLLSNLTFCVSKNQSANFEKWLIHELNHNSSLFSLCKEIQKYKLLTVVDEESENFSVQFYFSSQIDYQLFTQNSVPVLLQNAQLLFAGEFAHFPTLLKSI